MVIPEEMVSKWAGYSDESISDSELLSYLGLEGNSIPSWYKKSASKWLFDGLTSQEEFVNALKFLYKKGFLTK